MKKMRERERGMMYEEQGWSLEWGSGVMYYELI